MDPNFFEMDTVGLPLTAISFDSIQAPQSNSTPIHFSSANGLPVGVYSDFLKVFAKTSQVTAVDCRATVADIGAPPRAFDLHDFADDLIKIIEAQHQQKVIGMGHSFGAHVSLIAAIKRPDLFEKLVLIEPASLPNALLDLVYRRLPGFMVDRMLPMIPRTRARQRQWLSRADFMARYRRHKTYLYLTDQAFAAYAEYGLRPLGQEYELVFDPRWEAHIFSKVEFVWKNLKKVHVPTLFIRAEHSSLYSHQLFTQQNQRLPGHIDTLELDGTYHLMPLEHPQICQNAVLEWLAR